MITGATRVVGIIGDPVSHSRSPAIHNAAFAALELDYAFVAFPVRAGAGFEAVRAVRTLGLAGLNVTMPHKDAAARACDELTPAGAALGAVNTVVRQSDGSLLGASTDGEGLVRALADQAVEPAGRRILVLGAGGAARAIVQALGAHGATVAVAARRFEAATAAAALAPGSHTVSLPDVAPWIADADVVVNATPLGMQGEPPPLPTDALHAGQLVVDTVYHPPETPLVAAARAHGARATNGLGMLVHQAALAFEYWTGRAAPLDVMRRAGDRVTGALAALAAAVGVALAPALDLLATRVPRGAIEHPIPRRRFVFALFGAGLLAATAARFTDSWVLPAYLVLAVGLLLLSVIDIERFLLPNVIVYPLTLVTAALLALAALIDHAGAALLRAGAAAAVTGAAFALLHLVFPAGLAAGDVKLSVVLGLATGWLGWGEVFLALLLSFLLGAVGAGALVAFAHRHRSDPVPFGPFLAAGTLAAVLVGTELLDWYAGT